MSAQARHTKKLRRHIEKQAYNPLPCRKSLRIATTLRRSMAEETCSLMEGSRSERDTSSSNSDNPSNESKQTNNKLRIQTKVGDAQVASSTTKKMPKLIQSKRTPIKSLEQVGSHINHVIVFPKWISKIGVTQSNPNVNISSVVFSLSLFFSLSVFLCFFVWSLLRGLLLANSMAEFSHYF